MHSRLGQLASRNVHVDLLSCTQALDRMTSRNIHVNLLSYTEVLDRWLSEMFMQTYCLSCTQTLDRMASSCRPIVLHSSLGQMASRNVHADLLSCTQALDRMASRNVHADLLSCTKPWTDGFQKCSCRPIVMHSSLGQITSRNVHADLLSCAQALDRRLPEMFM